MILRKYLELYELVNEDKKTPSEELKKKIEELKKEIDRILVHSYDSH